MKFITPSAKNIKISLKKFINVKATRCVLINGKMYLNVKIEDKELVDKFLSEYDFCNYNKTGIYSFRNLDTIEYPALVIKQY